MEIVLNVSKLLRKVVDVVIVDDRNRAHGLFLFVPLLCNQMIADSVANRLRARLVFLLNKDSVKVIKQMMVERHREADRLLHESPSSASECIS